jgi:DNA-binding response OmpR family regulator
MSSKILWADDEIELLKPHVLFLREKGFDVTTVNNGNDAIELVEDNSYDIIFLDENMPGLSGLETLTEIKSKKPTIPVVMITKSEEEAIMEEAIGSKISDYLIKPVNPNQILLSIKKNLENRKLINEATTSRYQTAFREIGMTLSDRLDAEEWKEVYQKLVYWELELHSGTDHVMEEVLEMQKTEANASFAKFLSSNYLEWLKHPGDDTPVMSHNLFKQRVLPEMDEAPLFMILIDNLRYDQWKMMAPVLSEKFEIENEEIYYSILPTATQYSRNALFAGLMPGEIQKLYPGLWKNDDEDGGKNLHEEELLAHQLKRLGRDVKMSFNKITKLEAGKKLVDNIHNLMTNDLNVIVYNFVDMLSHARTDMEVIRELADDDAAYRSLTMSWFEHSALREIFEKIADLGARVVITTDHGTVQVNDPVKVIGDRNTSTNLRYKQGRNLNYNEKEVFAITKPEEAYLPKSNMSTSYIFAREQQYFVYPNNYNHFMKFYKNTFQHGGISLEEVLIPFVVLNPRQ